MFQIAGLYARSFWYLVFMSEDFLLPRARLVEIPIYHPNCTLDLGPPVCHSEHRSYPQTKATQAPMELFQRIRDGSRIQIRWTMCALRAKQTRVVKETREF